MTVLAQSDGTTGLFDRPSPDLLSAQFNSRPRGTLARRQVFHHPVDGCRSDEHPGSTRQLGEETAVRHEIR